MNIDTLHLYEIDGSLIRLDRVEAGRYGWTSTYVFTVLAGDDDAYTRPQYEAVYDLSRVRSAENLLFYVNREYKSEEYLGLLKGVSECIR